MFGLLINSGRRSFRTLATGKIPFIEAGPEIIFKVGYYKEHPIIPEDMSDKAKNFILKCFEGDPDKRLKADQLLEEPFLTDPKESRKKPPTGRISTQTTGLLTSSTTKNGYFEFNRSASVPSGESLANVSAQSSNTLNSSHLDNQTLVNGKATKIARFTSNEERLQDKKNQSLKINIKSANNQNAHHHNNGFLNVSGYSNVDTDSNSPNILTPNSMNFDESPLLSRKRGTSSDIMCSPPVNDLTFSGSTEEHFFVVKKEGQRRATLFQIMTENADEICDAWHQDLEKQPGQCLERTDLNLLLNGLQSCVNGDNDDILYNNLNLVKNGQLEKGHQLKDVIKEIKNALYSVREPLNNILRTRNIKPHWIFGLGKR